MTMQIEGFAGSTPWAAEVSEQDPFVDYASNLSGAGSGLDGLEMGMGDPEDFPNYLGPSAGRQPGFLADTEVEEEYLGALQDMGEPGFDWNVWTGEERVGTIAGAALGMALLPTIMQRMSNAPVGYGMAVTGAALGAAMGNRWPYGGVLTMALLFGADYYGLLDMAAG